MSTPKEKAQELIEKMYSANQPYTFEPKSAKKCAIICVDEIIDIDNDRLDCDYNFWYKVKQELEKM